MLNFFVVVVDHVLAILSDIFSSQSDVVLSAHFHLIKNINKTKPKISKSPKFTHFVCLFKHVLI
jgi:hypothetical protein